MKTVAFLLFPNFVALDLTGPAEAFVSANFLAEGDYQNLTVGISEGGMRSESGVVVLPDVSIDQVDASGIDTLILPGGAGLREPETRDVVARWLRQNHQSIRRVATICTGFFGLAESGLLNERRATTHWRFAEQARAQFPEVELDSERIFIKDGSFYTSAGATAGIDLALSLIDEDLGPKAALTVARELVVYVKRSGGQGQFSDLLRSQSRNTDVFKDLVHWIPQQLHQTLTNEVLAKQACMSTRHFARRFKSELGCTPASYVEQLRIAHACEQLLNTEDDVDAVAASVGFSHANVFRRAFTKHLGVSPTTYRENFGK